MIAVGSALLGAGTFAQMKAISNPPDGVLFTVTNYGRGGSLWHYSASLSDWFPIAPTKVYENTALITRTAQTADQVLQAIPIEAGLLANKTFRLIFEFGKTGTTDASGVLSFRFGTAGTTADAQAVNTSGNMAAGNRSVGMDAWFRMASATSVLKLGGSVAAPFYNFPSGTTISAATTIPSVASQATFVTLTTTMAGATDAPQLGYVALEIQP